MSTYVSMWKASDELADENHSRTALYERMRKLCRKNALPHIRSNRGKILVNVNQIRKLVLSDKNQR